MATIRRGQVVVITGASSGIGRATALKLAANRAKLILVARDPEKLEECAREVRLHGGEARIFPADVADGEAMILASAEAVRAYGRLDVWINNAGVGALGSFTEVPLNEHRRVIDTNLLGYINGAYAALSVFKRQGYGVLINNASICARLATPHLSSYTASKFAIRGLTHALRQDLALEGFKRVQVCEINPGVIDTPAFSAAANRSGHDIPLNVPMSAPQDVAQAILSLIARPRREIFVGHFARLGAFMYTLFPGFTAWFIVFVTRRYYKHSASGRPRTGGNLFKPVHNKS